MCIDGQFRVRQLDIYYFGVTSCAIRVLSFFLVLTDVTFQYYFILNVG